MFSETLASFQKIALLGFEVMIKATGWADLITAYTKFLMQRIRMVLRVLGLICCMASLSTTTRRYLQEKKHTTWLYQTESVTVVN